MEKTILIEAKTVGGLAPVKVLDFERNGKELDFFYKHVECDCIDIVKAMAFDNDPKLADICMVVDDEALCKGEPVINVIASLLYGYLEHGQPIAGNVLICKDVYTEEGTETGGLTEEEVSAVMVGINELVHEFNYRMAKGYSQTE